MNLINKYIGDLFLPLRFFVALFLCIIFFVLGYFIPALEPVALLIFLAVVFLVVTDYVFLFFNKAAPTARRYLPKKFSNGEENPVRIQVKNRFTFPVFMELIDEIPYQFYRNNNRFKLYLKARSQTHIELSIRPVRRGEYHFGDIQLFVNSPLKLITRKITIEAAKEIAVYPSFLQLHKFQILSNATSFDSGGRRMRKSGQSMEFEQIKEYVAGDDIREMNWKATARRGGLMVNTFMEERSQQVYCIIDKGRLMKMPFEEMTLLDYAINSTLILSSVCLRKQDRVGVITFADTVDDILAADKLAGQTQKIMELLYKQETGFLESDFENLYGFIRGKIKHRSLLILFTNFETLSGLERQLEYLRALAKYHLLLVVFFENTELNTLIEKETDTIEDIYVKTVAERFAFQKRLIARELSKYGILSLLTTPQKLTPNSITKYLEIKSRQAL